jgi:gluconolactonase
VDREGRVIVTEAGARRVTRTEKDGSLTVLAAEFEGKRFNSPNDLAIDSNGRIYFTDPRYGSRDGMEIRDNEGKTVEGVYRIDAPGKVVRVLTHEVDRPNGILIANDGKYIYVADNNNGPGGRRRLLRFVLRADGAIDGGSRQVVFDWKNGRGPDGLKTDRRGRLFVAAGLNQPSRDETTDEFRGGIYILSPPDKKGEGKLLEFVSIPKDEVTNCAFGDGDLKTLYITAGDQLWKVRTKEAGRLNFLR